MPYFAALAIQARSSAHNDTKLAQVGEISPIYYLSVYEKASHLTQSLNNLKRGQFEGLVYFKTHLLTKRKPDASLKQAARIVGRFRQNWMLEQMNTLEPAGLVTKSHQARNGGFRYKLTEKAERILATYEAEATELARRMIEEGVQSIPAHKWPHQRQSPRHYKPKPGTIEYVPR